MLENKNSLPAGVDPYVRKAVAKAAEICGGSLVSVRVFGSAAHEDYDRSVSDVDLLFIVRDDFRPNKMKRLVSELDNLGVQTSSRGSAGNSSFFTSLASRSVFFKPYFVFHESTLVQLNFSKLMSEGQAFDFFWKIILRLLASQLTPWRLVLTNVLNHSRPVFGTQDFGRSLELNWSVEMARSFLFSFAVALLGAEVSFVSADGTLIALEAMKWYFVNRASTELKRPASLKEALARYSPLHPRIASELVNLRRNYHSSRRFALACPLYLGYMTVRR